MSDTAPSSSLENQTSLSVPSKQYLYRVEKEDGTPTGWVARVVETLIATASGEGSGSATEEKLVEGRLFWSWDPVEGMDVDTVEVSKEPSKDEFCHMDPTVCWTAIAGDTFDPEERRYRTNVTYMDRETKALLPTTRWMDLYENELEYDFTAWRSAKALEEMIETEAGKSKLSFSLKILNKEVFPKKTWGQEVGKIVKALSKLVKTRSDWSNVQTREMSNEEFEKTFPVYDYTIMLPKKSEIMSFDARSDLPATTVIPRSQLPRF